MQDATQQPAPSAPRAVGLRRRLRLAGAALLWERFWPALWPAMGVLGAFVALALFDLPPLLPGWLHLALLVVVVALLAAAVWTALGRIRLPGHAEARRRLETASGLAHRPLAALEDRLASGTHDPASLALWELHQARMAETAAGLKVGVPAAGLARRDPFALRMALGLVLLLGAIDAGRDWPDRLARAMTPHLHPSLHAASVSLDIWVTPPDYTGLPPRFLPAAAPEAPIPVPTGSTVLAQVHGGRNAPQLRIDGRPVDFNRVDDSNFKGTTVLTDGSRLAVEQDGATLGQWPIAVLPDRPPTVGFVRPPQPSERAALRLEYRADDDYGVDKVTAVIHRLDDKNGPALTIDLPLPGPRPKSARETSYQDLTAHLWAGLPVSIELQAVDAIGQKGTSDTVEMVLPERTFHNPVARAIVEQRKELTLHPDEREMVAETLSDLSVQPGFYDNDIVVFLALRTAQARLQLDREDGAVPAVQQLLWQTALRIEDGRASASQTDVRQAMQALQDALARDAPDAEIERLTQELRQAIDRYLQALAENAQRRDGDQTPFDPSKTLSAQDLKSLLDRAHDLARTGNRDRARDLLSQLQDMLENLKSAHSMAMQGHGGQAMRQMQDLMQRQQQLLDRSFRQSRQGQRGQMGGGDGQPGGGQPGGQQGRGDAAQQEALRRALGDLMRQLGEQQGGDIPQALGQAERAMRDAGEALGHGQPGQAIGPQTEALDSLQQAARSLAQQMLGNAEGQRDAQRSGNGPGDDRDPFGRLSHNERDDNGLDDGGAMRMGPGLSDQAMERAKQILDELRQRAGERDRPEIERDYIDRLLKQF
jgi:uncharacterized protein (TIGR02302 family)